MGNLTQAGLSGPVYTLRIGAVGPGVGGGGPLFKRSPGKSLGSVFLRGAIQGLTVSSLYHSGWKAASWSGLYERTWFLCPVSAKAHENCRYLGVISGCSLHPDSTSIGFEELLVTGSPLLLPSLEGNYGRPIHFMSQPGTGSCWEKPLLFNSGYHLYGRA